MTDPGVVGQMANAAAQAQASAQYIELLTTIQIVVQTFGIVGVGLIGIWQFTLRKSLVLLERNTNSIKDELVAVTASANLAKGKLQGRAELQQERDRNA